jgi:hypothetical protein
MPEGSINGREIIRTKSKGNKWFAVGEEGEAFKLDVIATSNQWLDISRSFENESGVVPADKLMDLNRACWKFVKDLATDPDGKCLAPDISLAEALEFMRLLIDESEKLRSFFERKPSREPSLPESTELTFST